MSHFFTFATNANGIVADPNLNTEVAQAIAPSLGFSDVFVYSHGWWTDATAAANSYNQFSIGFVTRLLASRQAEGSRIGAIPGGSLNIGIHWPSTVSEDGGMISQLLQPGSFFTMETRADDVGETGVNGLLLAILKQWQLQQRTGTLNINLLGHSFGTKVVCSALQQLALARAGNTALCANVNFRVVLLQAAFDTDDFEAGQLYSDVPGLPSLKVMISKSTMDLALGKCYPDAHLLEFFKKTNRTALGYAGPSPNTPALFGGVESVNVGAGSDFSAVDPFEKRLVVADLTSLHTANQTYNGGAAGHHSDVFHDEIYSLITRFLY